MRSFPCLFILGVFCLSLAQFSASAQEKKAKEQPEKTDITIDVRTMNSAQYGSPPTTFRTGKATGRQFDANAIKKTANGFVIQLPSKAPIPTPTVYKGKIYVSGGFHSREYYCFDAVTGKLEWAVDLDDDGPTSAVCEDDICVFNTESCTIFALDAKTGKHLWSKFLGDPLTSTPTIANGKVFTSYPAGAAGNGLPANQFAPGGKAKGAKGPPIPPPAPLAKNQQEIAKDKKKAADSKEAAQMQGLLRPNATHVMICIDLKSGNILWQRWIDSDVMSAPVAIGGAKDGEVYAASFAGTVYKLAQADGTILSAQRSRATSAPVVVGNNVYMTKRADSKDGKVQEQIASVGRAKAEPQTTTTAKPAPYLDPRVQDKSELAAKGKKLDAGNGFGNGPPATANPQAAWANVGQGNVSTMQGFQGARVLHYQNGNFNCMGDVVVSTDPATGKVNWTRKLDGNLEKLGGFLAAPPAAAGGKIFLATLQGEVLQLDPATGNTLATYKVGSPIRSQPAIEGGRIYVGTQDGKVFCIDTGNKEFTGWSTWGANSAHTNTVVDKK